MLWSVGSFGSQRYKDWTAIPLAAAPPILECLSEPQRARFAGLLVRVAAKRERFDFAELFGFYAPRVKTYLVRLGADDPLAEQITQEIMVSVWTTADQFDPERSSVSSWIFRLARARRSDAYHIPLTPGADPIELVTVSTDAREPVSAKTALDLEEQVRSALRGLSLEQREAIRLLFYEGRSVREIARQWGFPLAVAEGLIRTALSGLRAAPRS